MKNEPLAKLIHFLFSGSRSILEAIKYEMAETIEATKASTMKNWPT
jgi:hypothetical protein